LKLTVDKKTDRVWGIDRYPQSLEYGEITQEQIYLWVKPGCKPTANNLIGVLLHGHEVDVLEILEDNGARFAKVEAVISYQGTDYINRGWVTCKLLKDLGKDEAWG